MRRVANLALRKKLCYAIIRHLPGLHLPAQHRLHPFQRWPCLPPPSSCCSLFSLPSASPAMASMPLAPETSPRKPPPHLVRQEMISLRPRFAYMEGKAFRHGDIVSPNNNWVSHYLITRNLGRCPCRDRQARSGRPHGSGQQGIQI